VPWVALPGKRPGSYLVEDYAITTAGHGQQVYALLTETRRPRGGLLLLGGAAYGTRPSATPPEATQGALDTTHAAGMKERPEWKGLDETLGEVRAIEKLKEPSTRSLVLSGAAAGETALRERMPQSRYIHLATHGFFATPEFRSMFHHDVAGEQVFGGRPQLPFGGAKSCPALPSAGQSLVPPNGQAGEDRPMVSAALAGVTVRNPLILSGVVLAGANLPPVTDSLGLPTGEDGILTAEEIVSLDLRNTELVVLSACETGLGKVGGGEGVMGLQRAFHMTGARTVVASLWKVHDAATRALMTEFYKNLWKKKLGKLEALRQAQLTMLKRYDPKAGTLRRWEIKPANQSKLPKSGRPLPPFYWAAFVLSGDWR